MGEVRRNSIYSPPARTKRRNAIRERARNGLLDLKVLVEYLDENELEEIFKRDEDSDGEEAPPAWPLAAMLYLWAQKRPMFTNETDVREFLSSPDKEYSSEEHLARVTKSFNNQVEKGVSTAIEFRGDDRVPEEVTNELVVSLGDSTGDMTDEELATLPRRMLDLLFRRGDLNNEEYAKIMQLKLESES
ncbi:hypothetical protein [Natrinema halophilum]|nr:hypothetical protein [Natrinema halophilum]QLG49109.2 hypothetical protein HYG82_09725 [Natrinema halophilum]